MVAKSSNWRTLVYAADDVTWAKWGGHDALEVWQLVALHSNVDPDSLGIGSRGALSTFATVTFFDNAPVHPPLEINHEDPFRRLKKNLDSAEKAVEGGSLKRYVDRYQRPGEVKATDPSMAKVAVSDFHAWSLRTGLPVVDGWPARPSASPEHSDHRWPWGSHETWRLRIFAEIAEQWRLVSEGGPFDPTDSSTAPKKEVIVPMIQAMPVPSLERPISDKVAGAMFTMLSPDDLPKGPRGMRKAK
jgi:hypothetical protein